MPSPVFTSECLLAGLLNLSRNMQVAVLDSCGSNSLGSHNLIAGINPLETIRLRSGTVSDTLEAFDRAVTNTETACIFTVSYDFGRKIYGFPEIAGESREPDIFISVFENLIVYDYLTGALRIEGNSSKRTGVARTVEEAAKRDLGFDLEIGRASAASNLSRKAYMRRVEAIREKIREGYTYQANLTQKFTVALSSDATPQSLFYRLRKTHPAAFSAFISRGGDHVLSISPERLVEVGPETAHPRIITASPVKGTIRRGEDPGEDLRLMRSLRSSEKNRAENIMIVDLVRNDLGRICEYGTVSVEKLCELEEHPTLFHLVSTVRGNLRPGIKPSDVLRAVFPCGSISGCPKKKTMEIIDGLEAVPRGLSMGAIGYSGFDNRLDMSVAIRTMVVGNGVAEFNVGGGIVIDSVAEDEYAESMLKAKALLVALNVTPD